VTVVTKANIMKYTDGLFFEVAREVAKRYPGVEYEERLIDNMCMQLVQKPELYDVICLPNLYGDILSDLCAGLIGGLGIAPGANHGKDIALFEAVHGSAPKYTGMNKVNPTAVLLSSVLMLEHIGEGAAAKKLEAAIAAVIAEGKDVTYDMKPRPDDPTAVGTTIVHSGGFSERSRPARRASDDERGAEPPLWSAVPCQILRRDGLQPRANARARLLGDAIIQKLRG
jgi:isocitrate dehydrogenase (NAD+)